MSDLPSKLTALTYVVPLSHGDKIIGTAKVIVEKVSVSTANNYIRPMLDEAALELTITDSEFQHMLGSKLLRGFSISPEEE